MLCLRSPRIHLLALLEQGWRHSSESVQFLALQWAYSVCAHGKVTIRLIEADVSRDVFWEHLRRRIGSPDGLLRFFALRTCLRCVKSSRLLEERTLAR